MLEGGVESNAKQNEGSTHITNNWRKKIENRECWIFKRNQHITKNKRKILNSCVRERERNMT